MMKKWKANMTLTNNNHWRKGSWIRKGTYIMSIYDNMSLIILQNCRLIIWNNNFTNFSWIMVLLFFSWKCFSQNPSEVMFEKGSLTAMRFITAVDIDHPECTENLSRELWMRAWCRVRLNKLCYYSKGFFTKDSYGW